MARMPTPRTWSRGRILVRTAPVRLGMRYVAPPDGGATAIGRRAPTRYPGEPPDPNAPFDGTLMAEMAMRWYSLGNDPAPSARLEIYDESWAALAGMPDLLLMLGSMSRHERISHRGQRKPALTVEEFTKTLDDLGFVRRG